MFKVWQYDGKLEEGNVDDLAFHKTKWVDCFKPTKEDYQKLSDKIGVLVEDLIAFSDGNERPTINEIDHYSVLIIQAPTKKRQWARTSSFAMLISENLLVTIRKEETIIDEILALSQDKLGEFLAKGTSHLSANIMKEVINDYFRILDDAEEKINKIEDKVFNNPERKTVQDIFQLKNTLVYFHKGLSGNRDVLMKADTATKIKLTQADQRQLRYTYADTVQLLDVAATYRDILTGALDIYLSSVSNNLNHTMKNMTAWGSLVLVPTLIASIYGMNFRHLPELNWLLGYPFALLLMVLSAFLLYLFFRKKGYM
ncbi:MAG: magnesium/cobalt transporter CorA [Candidatus Woesearchaeota archaeon]